MALEVAHGTIEWLTSTTAGNGYSVTGLPFQPKAIMFFWVNVASGGADTATETNDQRCGVGFAVSPSARRAISSYDDDAAGTSDCGTVAADDCIACTLDNAAARDGELDITAFNSDGFDLTVDDQLAVNNMSIHWIAWGGDDIDVAVVGDFAEPAAAGDVSPTATGLTSDGANQVVIVASVQSSNAINTAHAENGGISIGFATGTGAADQCTVATSVDHASATTDTDGIGGTGKVLAQAARAGGTAFVTGALSAWGTDQFTITYAGTVVAGRKAIFLAMKGGQWKAGGMTIDGNTASATSAVSGLPFAPKGIALTSCMTTENTGSTGTTQARLAIGVGTSTSSRRCSATFNENNTASSNVEVNKVVEYDQVMAHPTAAGAVTAQKDINAMNSDGFELIVDSTGGVASEWIGYLAFGDDPPPANPPPPVVMAPMRPAGW